MKDTACRKCSWVMIDDKKLILPGFYFCHVNNILILVVKVTEDIFNTQCKMYYVPNAYFNCLLSCTDFVSG